MAAVKDLPQQPPERAYFCPRNPRAWLMSSNSPWGKTTAYCRHCRKAHTVLLGKAPADEMQECEPSRAA